MMRRRKRGVHHFYDYQSSTYAPSGDGRRDTFNDRTGTLKGTWSPRWWIPFHPSRVWVATGAASTGARTVVTRGP